MSISASFTQVPRRLTPTILPARPGYLAPSLPIQSGVSTAGNIQLTRKINKTDLMFDLTVEAIRPTARHRRSAFRQGRLRDWYPFLVIRV